MTEANTTATTPDVEARRPSCTRSTTGRRASAAGAKCDALHTAAAHDLLAQIAEIEAIEREDDRLWNAYAHLPGRTPESDAWQSYIDATRPRWRELAAQIGATPARTADELRSKARVALVLLPAEDNPDPGEIVARSVLQDIIGTADVDSELLDTFRQWQPHEVERQAIEAIYVADPDAEAPDGRHIADDRYDAWHKGWHDLVDRVIELPARTPEGVQAKATVLRAALDFDGVADTFGNHAYSMSGVLTWSLLRDLLAGGGA